MKKAIIAYSGGLDTSYCLVSLKRKKKYHIHTVIVNTGGFQNKELEKIEILAYKFGSDKHKTINIVEQFYDECIKYLIFGNILKNSTYPLSVSAERIFQAIAIAKYAKKEKADYIVHGSTGAGNDQIRFDAVFSIICPEISIITPIRDEKINREEEINYLKQEGFLFSWEKSKYSINKGIWGTTIGGAETLTSHETLPSSAFSYKIDKNLKPIKIELDFLKGEPVAFNNKKYDSIKIIQKINELGNLYGIGRDIHVGDTILGIKGRIGFEAPAAIILIKSHHLLEKHTLSRWQLIQKEQISIWYTNLLHEAQFMDPVMRDFEMFFTSSQNRVSGKVFITLIPGQFILNGIYSIFDMMNSKIASYGETNSHWNGKDVKGFIKIFSNQIKIWESLKMK